MSVAIRPEKIWLSELTPAMVQVPGTVVASSYHGATTQYLVDVAPDVTLTVLEQNLPRMSTGDRWTPGLTRADRLAARAHGAARVSTP